MSKINEDTVINEGFKPLKKTKTEPIPIPSKPMITRGNSINAETGEKESAQGLWDDHRWEKLNRSRGRTMSRANTFVGSGLSTDEVQHDEVIAVVDPFSTGAHLAAEVCRQGYKCARVLSAWDSPVAALVQQGLKSEFCATIQHDDRMENQNAAIEKTVNELKALPFKLLAVIPGAETGVELADELSSRLNLRTNGVEGSVARRNKYFMGEKVRNAGVWAVQQASCTSIAEVKDFVATLEDPSKKCVVKPVQSAGSDDVFLCNGLDEAITAFNKIIGTKNGLGLDNECVLVQEFLVGKEYVVDKVSRDGVHKLVGIWEYDKRVVNGANFVYFGMRLKPADTEMAQVMVKYADEVLNALDIMQGPSHMEVMLNTLYEGDRLVYKPCLVEVGARCQGGEGTWLGMAKECIGYTQVEVTLDVYLKGELFDSIEKDVYPALKAGREVDVCNRHGGIIRGIPGDAKIRALPSFRGVAWECKPGDYIHKTIDCFTRPGSVQLVADTEEEADRDFEAIHSLEEMGLFDYSVICPKPPSIGAVVVVDPFSSGANLAAMILLWGYKLILVFSEKDSPVQKLVSKGTKVEPTLLIQHDDRNPDQVAAELQTLKAIEEQGSPILAIIPGAETGVMLADSLANRYGTRVNSAEYGEARRNKFLMQEVLRKQGKIRSVQQLLCRSEEEVRKMADSLVKMSPTGTLKCVVKPNESAGTDSVYLCYNVEDAIAAFHCIHGQLNGLGQLNDGALVQEFLQGTEFVVDGVSRDGVYKITAVWEYDKRTVNGANFVYYGMSLRDPHGGDKRIRAVVEYAKEVVKGLKINHGPTHMEIIGCEVLKNGAVHYSPCLVEVGIRCHGGEGSWLPVAAECIGYTQLDATLNCYLRPDRFDALPPEPTLTKQGTEAFLVSLQKGTLKDIPGLETIRHMSSFRKVEMLIQPGGALSPTIDCFTRPGSVQLVNSSSEQLATDYGTIRELERHGLFELL